MRHLRRSHIFTREAVRHNWQAYDLTNRILDFPAGWVRQYLPNKSRYGITGAGKYYSIGNPYNYGASGSLDYVVFWCLQYECRYQDLVTILSKLNRKAQRHGGVK